MPRQRGSAASRPNPTSTDDVTPEVSRPRERAALPIVGEAPIAAAPVRTSSRLAERTAPVPPAAVSNRTAAQEPPANPARTTRRSNVTTARPAVPSRYAVRRVVARPESEAVGAPVAPRRASGTACVALPSVMPSEAVASHPSEESATPVHVEAAVMPSVAPPAVAEAASEADVQSTQAAEQQTAIGIEPTAIPPQDENADSQTGQLSSSQVVPPVTDARDILASSMSSSSGAQAVLEPPPRTVLQELPVPTRHSIATKSRMQSLSQPRHQPEIKHAPSSTAHSNRPSMSAMASSRQPYASAAPSSRNSLSGSSSSVRNVLNASHSRPLSSSGIGKSSSFSRTGGVSAEAPGVDSVLSTAQDEVKNKNLLEMLVSNVKLAQMNHDAGETEEARRVFRELSLAAPIVKSRALYWISWASIEQSAGDPLTAMQLVESGLSACRSSADQYDMLIEALRMHTQQIFMAKTNGVAATHAATATVPTALQATAPAVPTSIAPASSTRAVDVPTASTMHSDAPATLPAAMPVNAASSISLSELASPAPKQLNASSASKTSVTFTPEHEQIVAAPVSEMSPGEQAVMTALTPHLTKKQGRLSHTPSSGATASSPGESAVRKAMNTPLPIQERIVQVFFSPASPAPLALSMLSQTSKPAPTSAPAPSTPAASHMSASIVAATPIPAVFASAGFSAVATPSTPATIAAVETQAAHGQTGTSPLDAVIVAGTASMTPEQQDGNDAIGVASEDDVQQEEDDAIDTAILRAALEMGKARQVTEAIAAQTAATPMQAPRKSISFVIGSSVKRLSPEQRAALRVLSTPGSNNKSNITGSHSKGFASASKPKSASKSIADVDISTIQNLGSRIVLEAVRATPALEKRIGTSTYLTSVRRSVRVKTASKTHDKDSLDGVTKSVTGDITASTVDASPSQETLRADPTAISRRQLYHEMEQAAAPEVVTPEKGAPVETPEKAVEARVPASILRSTARHTGANTSVRFMSPTSPSIRVSRVALGTTASPEATAAAALRSSMKSGIFARTPGSASTTPSKARRELVSEPTEVFAKCEKHVIIDVEMPSSTLAEANGAWMANPYIPFGGGLDPRTGKPYAK